MKRLSLIGTFSLKADMVDQNMVNSTDRSAVAGRGVAQAGVRIANERAIMTLIGLNPGSSNADLARLSGLGPQTTSRIVSDLETRDLIRRGGVVRGRRGQPATPLFINTKAAFAIGVEIGWRRFEIMLTDMSGETIGRVCKDYAWPDASTIFTDIATEVTALKQSLTPEERQRLIGLGLACPSLIELNILNLGAPAAQHELWKELDVGARLQRDTGLATQWWNDGSAACWGEYLSHPTPRPRNMAYFQIGTYVGAGIVVNRELWEGPGMETANLGALMVTDLNGKPAFVFQVASILALEARLRDAGLQRPAGNPTTWDWDRIEPVATQWIEAAAFVLAQAVITTRAMVEVDLVVIDGVLPRPVLDRLFAQVEIAMAKLPKSTLDRPELAKGRLGIAAGSTGASYRVLFTRFFSRAWDLFAT